MELEVLREAMTEQLKEEQITNKRIEELTGQVKVLTEKVAGFDKRLENLKVIAPPVDTTAIQDIVVDHLGSVNRIVAAQPKSIVRQWRVLFFPETNAGQYYKIVFGRLIPWGFLFVGCAFVFALCQNYIESSSRIRERQYYYEVYQDAWNRLDSTMGPNVRKKMQEALRQAASSK